MIGSNDSYSGGPNNFYVYRDATSGRLYFLPWGRDAAFSDPRSLPSTVPKSVKAMGILCKRLWALPQIQERYRKEMRRLLANVWDEQAMLSELARIRRLCQDDRSTPQERIDERMAGITRIIEGRRKEVEAELDGPAPAWPEFPQAVKQRIVDNGTPMQVEGSFSAVLGERFPTNLLGHGSAQLGFTINENSRTPFTRFGAAAVPKIEAAFVESFTEMSVIQIDATDTTGDFRWRVTFRIDPYRLTPGTVKTYPFCLLASIVQNTSKSSQPQFKSVGQLKGTLELTHVSTNLGGTISGKFKINTTSFEEEKKP